MLDIKKEEPSFFTRYKKKNQPHSYQDDCDDYTLRNNLRESLLQEQKNQCFYCEKKISNDGKVHLDHLKQRYSFHKLECSYGNMVLSCNGGVKEEHCGKYKDNQESWDDNKFLKILHPNPQLEEKVSKHFDYLSNGEIQPNQSLSQDSHKRAFNTINYLNLNHKNLIEARKNIFLQLELYKTSGFQIDKIFTYFQEFESLFKDIR